MRVKSERCNLLWWYMYAVEDTYPFLVDEVACHGQGLCIPRCQITQ